MKIIIIEADAEELRADRTLGESIRAALYRAVEAFGARTDTAAEDESEEEYEENAVEEPDHERVSEPDHERVSEPAERMVRNEFMR